HAFQQSTSSEWTRERGGLYYYSFLPSLALAPSPPPWGPASKSCSGDFFATCLWSYCEPSTLTLRGLSLLPAMYVHIRKISQQNKSIISNNIWNSALIAASTSVPDSSQFSWLLPRERVGLLA
ncbi:unnamed protein product, partial [Ectocarpus sp. 8 AP-2014]